MNRIALLEKRVEALRARLAECTDPEERGDLDEEIDYVQDEIDELEREVDPENIYGILQREDSPSLDMSLNYLIISRGF